MQSYEKPISCYSFILAFILYPLCRYPVSYVVGHFLWLYVQARSYSRCATVVLVLL